MSVVKLYTSGTGASAWRLIPSKLFKVDNIADYLANFVPTTINTFKYVKNGLEISIKVPMTQDKSQPNSSSGIKYVSILNDNENIAYYFVRKAVWRSENTIELELVMDVLNTYNDGTDYIFKENTRILREHKPRFTDKGLSARFEVSSLNLTGNVIGGTGTAFYWFDNQQQDWVKICDVIVAQLTNIRCNMALLIDKDEYASVKLAIMNNVRSGNTFLLRKNSSNYANVVFTSYAFYNNLYRVIDYVNENINPLLINNGQPLAVEASGLLAQNWYLLYRNQDNPSESLLNPVNCYLIPDVELPTDAALITGGRLIPSFIEEDKWYIFNVEGLITLSNGATANTETTHYKRILITRSGNKLNATLLDVTSFQASNLTSIIWAYDDIGYIDFGYLPAHYQVYTTLPELTGLVLYVMQFPYEFNNSPSQNNLYPIEQLDRTDPKNIKLIKLPYCPFNLSVSGGVIQINSSSIWEYGSFSQANGAIFYGLRLLNSNTKLERTFNAPSTNPFINLNHGQVNVNIEALRKPIEQGYESKLFHSEFFVPTFVYDSFSLQINLEKCKLDYYFNNTLHNDIKFTMTSTINSKFLFTFTSYVVDKSEQNFPNIIPVARNNEMVLYNVPYINYIRNGFNYDIKAKNLSNASNFIGLGLSGASFAASLALPSVPLKALGVIAGAIGLANSVKSTIVETIRNEDAIKQKLLQAQNQTASVSGSDDVDLMSEYCGNRLQYLIYQPSDNMKRLIYDLFFYAGYNSGRMGIPNHNTRINFDYLECDASLETAGANIPQEILDEIKNSYKTGVTFIHQTSRDTDKWDMEQKYENWERELVED